MKNTAKSKKEKPMTLTLRYKERPKDEKILKDIMRELGSLTGSGAIYQVCSDYMKMKKTINDLQQSKSDIEGKLNTLTGVIEHYFESQQKGEKQLVIMRKWVDKNAINNVQELPAIRSYSRLD